MNAKQLKTLLVMLRRLRVQGFKDGKLEVCFFEPKTKEAKEKDITIQAISQGLQIPDGIGDE